MIQQESEELLWSQVVARAWSDGAFMTRLRSEPRSVLADHGLEVPRDAAVEIVEGPEVKIVHDTDSVRHFVLPFRPPDELTEEELVGDGVAWYCGACGRCGACGCRCACRCRL